MGMFFNRPKRNFRGETPEEEAAREKVEKARLAQKQAAWRPLRGEELRGAVKTHLEEELEDRLGEKVDYDMNAPLIQYDMDELDIVELILAFEEIFDVDIPEHPDYVNWSGNDFFQRIQTALEATE